MYLRSHVRKKDGKQNRYFSIVEARRLSSGKSVQKRCLYLGEINDSQRQHWRKTLEVFDETTQRFQSMSLFPDDREVPVQALNYVQVKLGEMQLRNARAFGDCWLGCELWRQLQLDQFWSQRLAPGREAVPWSQVLQLLVVNRLIDPGSEFRLHRHWFDQTAMAELLGVDFAVASKDRLYRCLDRLLEHKQDLFVFLRQRWQDLFHPIRRAALRPDEHVSGRRSRTDSECQTRLQPRRAARLPPVGDCFGRHHRWLPVGL